MEYHKFYAKKTQQDINKKDENSQLNEFDILKQRQQDLNCFLRENQLSNHQLLAYYSCDAILLFFASMSFRKIVLPALSIKALKKNLYFDLLAPVTYLAYKGQEIKSVGGSASQEKLLERLYGENSKTKYMKIYNIQFWGNSQFWH